MPRSGEYLTKSSTPAESPARRRYDGLMDLTLIYQQSSLVSGVFNFKMWRIAAVDLKKITLLLCRGLLQCGHFGLLFLVPQHFYEAERANWIPTTDFKIIFCPCPFQRFHIILWVGWIAELIGSSFSWCDVHLWDSHHKVLSWEILYSMIYMNDISDRVLSSWEALHRTTVVCLPDHE